MVTPSVCGKHPDGLVMRGCLILFSACITAFSVVGATNSVSAAKVVTLPTESPKEASSDGSIIDYFGEMKGLVQETQDRISGSVYCEFASSYLSTSGSLVDTNPVASQELYGKFDFGEDYGWIDGYLWVISSLYNEQTDLHRDLFFELEYAVRYGYKWRLTKQTYIRTTLGLLADSEIGYPDDDYLYWGPHWVISYENPYITPYVNTLWMLQPKMRGRVVVGVRHPFLFWRRFTVTPFVETVWYDANRYLAKYGAESDQDFFGGGFATERAGLNFRWQINGAWAICASLQQYAVLGHQARASVRSSSAYYARTDLLRGTCGVEYSF